MCIRDRLKADTATRDNAAPNMEGLGGPAPASAASAAEPAAGDKEDPMKGLLDAVKEDKKK